MKKILIFGLPGSGKSTFAQKLVKDKPFAYFNADEIRKIFNDWDFSEKGRTKQALRMAELCRLANKTSVVDFICPYDHLRKHFDITVFMNTINNSRYENTNKIFEQPVKVDFEIKDFNYDHIMKEIYDRL
jgi:adenylylsulfate kinase